MGPGQLMLEIFGDTISASFDNNGKVPRLPPSRLGAELSWVGASAGTYVAGAMGRGSGRARTF